MKKDIIIIAEIQRGSISPTTFEMVSIAGKLADVKSASIKILVIDNKADTFAEEIAIKTGCDVLAVNTPNLVYYNGTAFKAIIQRVLDEMDPIYICIAHSSQGVDYAPGLAVCIDASCISSISGYDFKDGDVIFERALYGGRINAYLKSRSEPVVLLIQPGCFKNKQAICRKGIVACISSDDIATGIKVKNQISPESDPAALSEAKTVVGIGRGINSPDNIIFAEQFSRHFSNAAVGCSRPVVDLGWMKYKYQIGITGSVIDPDIYIACGISGSSQHIAGMRASEYVISINSDPNATIFNVSDICIVDDMFDFFNAFDDVVKK